MTEIVLPGGEKTIVDADTAQEVLDRVYQQFSREGLNLKEGHAVLIDPKGNIVPAKAPVPDGSIVAPWDKWGA